MLLSFKFGVLWSNLIGSNVVGGLNIDRGDFFYIKDDISTMRLPVNYFLFIYDVLMRGDGGFIVRDINLFLF